jgi:tetratricopeptide (TPR) repeat protein
VERLRAAGLEDDLVRADALTALRRYALLSGSEASLTIHRLVQQVYRDQMGEAEAQSYLSAATELIIAVRPDGARLHEWAEGQQLLPHMVAASDLAAAMTWESEPAAFLANWTGYYLKYLADYSQARPYYEQALAIWEKALGPDHPDTATSLNNLGALLQAMGHLAEARPYLERALAIREKALGPDHDNEALLQATAQSLNNLGALLQAMGHLAEARPYYQRALAIYEKALGPDHPDTARSLNNLAILAYYQRDLTTAAQLMRRALAIREQRLGPDHPDTQSSRDSLAVIESSMNRKWWQFWR